jgi:NTP pyrophosphatase (non-canonical NTP hydrolase)
MDTVKELRKVLFYTHGVQPRAVLQEALSQLLEGSDDALRAINKNARHFESKMWTDDRPDERRFLSLVSEVGELSDAIKGKHEHPTEVELIQIAGICLNWLRVLDKNGIDLEEALSMANHTG